MAATNLLDPTLDARVVRWCRDKGASEEGVALTENSQAKNDFLRSPFYYLTRQLVFAAVGTGAGVMMYLLPLSWWQHRRAPRSSRRRGSPASSCA